MTDDPYVYPGTSVLRNALGIRDDAELRRVEAQLTRIRAPRLAAAPLLGRYDLAHLQAFHRNLSEGLYEWAGQLRTVPIAHEQLASIAGRAGPLIGSTPLRAVPTGG